MFFFSKNILNANGILGFAFLAFKFTEYLQGML